MATYIASAHLIGDNLHQTDYEVGQQVRLDLNIYAADVLADPTTIALKTRDPLGNVTTQATVKDAIGQYHYDLTLATAGSTFATWTGTGTNPGAASVTLDAQSKAVP